MSPTIMRIQTDRRQVTYRKFQNDSLPLLIAVTPVEAMTITPTLQALSPRLMQETIRWPGELAETTTISSKYGMVSEGSFIIILKVNIHVKMMCYVVLTTVILFFRKVLFY